MKPRSPRPLIRSSAQKTRAGQRPHPVRRLGNPLKAGEIVAASRSLHTTLVEYALGADHSYVWVVDDGKIKSHVLPARKIIESAVREWRMLATVRLARPGASFQDLRNRVEVADLELPRVAARLSCMLLAPFLEPRMDHLAIVPDGELDLLPFAALPENGCDGGATSSRRSSSSRACSVPLDSAPSPSNDRPQFLEWRSRATCRSGVDVAINACNAPPAPRATNLIASALLLRASTVHVTKQGQSRLSQDRYCSALYLDFDASLQNLLSPSLSKYLLWGCHTRRA